MAARNSQRNKANSSERNVKKFINKKKKTKFNSDLELSQKSLSSHTEKEEEK